MSGCGVASKGIGWDPVVDSPATIGIIGAGQIGLEAALYARFLGYFVEIFESDRIGSNLAGQHDVDRPGTLAEWASPLARAALEAQGEDVQAWSELPATSTYLLNHYLLPLARTDLIHDHLHLHSSVVSVSRYRFSIDDDTDLQSRANDEFRILVRSRDRGDWQARVDVVFDCSGLSHQAAGLGPGGGLAIGEWDYDPQVSFRAIRFPSSGIPPWQGRQTVIWGDSEAAETTFGKLLELCDRDASTGITWMVPDRISRPGQERMGQIESIVAIAVAGGKRARLLRAVGIDAIERLEDRRRLRLLQADGTSVAIDCDFVLGLASPQPDWSLARSLLIDRHSNCQSRASTPSLEVPNRDRSYAQLVELLQADGILTGEPNYYVLGQKAAWPNVSKRIDASEVSAWQQQIRNLFAMMGDRIDLDLYKNFSGRSH